MKIVEGHQKYLDKPFEIFTEDFTDIVCEDCAIDFAKENNLEWRGGKAANSYTEKSEELGMGATCLEGYMLGESDTPYSCCDLYLETYLTPDGIEYVKNELPKWVQDLYLGGEDD